MKTKKKQCETHIYSRSERITEMHLVAVMDMLEAAAKGVNTMVRYAVSSVLKGMDNDQKAALPLTHTVRFRLESDWDRQYLQIGSTRRGPNPPREARLLLPLYAYPPFLQSMAGRGTHGRPCRQGGGDARPCSPLRPPAW